MLSFSVPVNAEPTCDPEDSRKCVVELKQGEMAPYTGDLFTIPLSIEVSQRANGCPERIKAAIEHEQARARIILTATVASKAAEIEAAEKRGFIKGKAEGREEASPGFFEHPAVIMLGTGLVLVGVFFAVKSGDLAIAKAFE